jgi:hypothetical protein
VRRRERYCVLRTSAKLIACMCVSGLSCVEWTCWSRVWDVRLLGCSSGAGIWRADERGCGVCYGEAVRDML